MASGIALEFSYINANDKLYQPVITESKKGKRYKWEMQNIPAFEYDDNAPNLTYYTPHIIPRIASYEKNGETIKVLETLDDLYNWYYSLVENTDKSATDEIKKIVDSLKAGSDSDFELISNIYYWAQDNIRYVAFEEGMQGFIPDHAGNVCVKRYGDCKGITSLLYTMLRYAGIDAYFYLGGYSR